MKDDEPMKAEYWEPPENLVDDIDHILDDMHKDKVNEALRIQSLRKRFQTLKPMLADMGHSTGLSSAESMLYSGSADPLLAYRNELRSLQQSNSERARRFNETLSSGSTLIDLTASAVGYAGIYARMEPVGKSNIPSIEQHRELARRLAELNPALGSTFGEVIEVLYGTRADPERAALPMARTAFDHFFAILAPDDQVRQSDCWSVKKGTSKPDQVYRAERLRYASRLVKDKARRETLLANATYCIKLFDGLNEFKKREPLDPANAQRTLYAILSVIRDWTDAVGV